MITCEQKFRILLSWRWLVIKYFFSSLLHRAGFHFHYWNSTINQKAISIQFKKQRDLNFDLILTGLFLHVLFVSFYKHVHLLSTA